MMMSEEENKARVALPETLAKEKAKELVWVCFFFPLAE